MHNLISPCKVTEFNDPNDVNVKPLARTTSSKEFNNWVKVKITSTYCLNAPPAACNLMTSNYKGPIQNLGAWLQRTCLFAPYITRRNYSQKLFNMARSTDLSDTGADSVFL